jgi:Domain of unknown function (DUF6702)
LNVKDRQRTRVFCAALALLALNVVAAAHPNSVSYAQFTVDGAMVRATVRLPLDDVDLLLRLDSDLDGQVAQAELEASRSAIAAYLTKHLSVSANGAPVEGDFGRVAVWRDASGFPYLEGELSYRASALERLMIHSDFLTDLYSSHKTLGRIDAAGREERFTFESASTYERELAASRTTTIAVAVGGLAILGLLLMIRRRATVAAVAMVLVATAAEADVIMSAAGLNTTLKTMEKLTREIADANPQRADALFRFGAEADALASLMNLEVESHGMQERALLDLALSRTKELGVTIAYNREKKKFFYDGAAFVEYVKAAPRGAHAAAAEFKLLSYQFYQSSANDVATLTAAADSKKRFLARYPRFEANAEMRLYLAVDYRDLYRQHADAHDAANAAKYRQLARTECKRIARLYPRTEQADAARQLLRALE